MSLILEIENFQMLDDGGPTRVQVPPAGLQAGRRTGMGWVLPDASRLISSHHFDVYSDGQNWLLADRSLNGTFLQGHRHRLDAPHRLQDGDRFQVGHYIIVACLDRSDPPAMSSGSLPEYQFTPPLEETPATGGDDPWSVGPALSPIDPMPAPERRAQADFAHDFVPFPAAPTPPHDPDTPAGPALTAPPPPVFAPAPDLASADASAPVPPDNAVPAPPPAQPETLPEAAPAVTAEPAQPLPAAPGMPAQSADVPVAAGNPAAFLTGFARGARLSPDVMTGIDAEAFGHALGETLLLVSDQLSEALRDRANARHFTRAGERSMRGATDNNPLKFLPDSAQSLEALFLRPRAGFMTGAAGYRDALSDLRRHQNAVFAALQPALLQLLGDLDPAVIEGETKSGALAGNKKARAWDGYVARWTEKCAHENGILDEFIRLFAEAYRQADQGQG